MIIDLSNAEFTNDFLSFDLPDGGTLVLNKIDESISYDNTLTNIKAVNMQVSYLDGSYIKCPSVIGLGNNLVKIITDYKEYEGKVLTHENMSFCKLEIYE